MTHRTEALICSYYDAFNRADWPAMLDLLADDVAHDVSQGSREVGRDAFARFLAHMDRCYRERAEGLVVLTEPSGHHAAAEFTIHGTYIATDPGVPAGTPPAREQGYVLPVGAFFTVSDNRITRVSNHYNLADWVRQVGG